ncbi:uncharacterized protein An15g06560 [Aspergillus niger]|uniref:Contig An15c0220, genomic contig n=2 Tax=Aspergillus niger TaxID=5061 RepID=A2R641_ASPNC|nr:uncharacterized protein An15g06560 [Aspergillus niger]CAK42608.1 unnamed protein product [Aspergillus niger]
MKTSTILLCLAPTIALAVEADAQIPPAVSPTPSLPNANPPAPLPEIPTPSNTELNAKLWEIRTLFEIEDNTDATRVQDQLPEPASGRIASTGETKALRARSEGTLGQTPWIGMAIGLTYRVVLPFTFTLPTSTDASLRVRQPMMILRRQTDRQTKNTSDMHLQTAVISVLYSLSQ